MEDLGRIAIDKNDMIEDVKDLKNNARREEFHRILLELIKLRDLKNTDYDNGFMDSYNEYGIIGLEFDIGRKFQRIKSFRKKGFNAVKNETMEDTLKDLAIMAINGLIWWRNKK
jgi:hypothetical protein